MDRAFGTSMAAAAPSSTFFLPSSSSSSSPSLLPWMVPRQQRRQSELKSLSLNHRILFPRRRQLPVALAIASIDGDVLEVQEIKEKSRKWQWKNKYSINYLVQSPLNGDDSRYKPPLVLVHGFGASIPHWRRNIMTLAQDHRVYAVDLLGFGLSDKPAGFMYTMEAWAEIIPLGSFSTVAFGFFK